MTLFVVGFLVGYWIDRGLHWVEQWAKRERERRATRG